jgi:membrane-associated PAP2 superfamily phosphatase
LIGIALIVAVWRPFGVLRRLDRVQRVQLALSTLAAVLLVSTMKSVSTTSCPWDLSAFGGVAHHISHWTWLRDGGGGHCFPAGHASAGFAFLGGWLVFRDVDHAVARRWLLASLIAGFGLVVLGGGAGLRHRSSGRLEPRAGPRVNSSPTGGNSVDRNNRRVRR